MCCGPILFLSYRWYHKELWRFLTRLGGMCVLLLCRCLVVSLCRLRYSSVCGGVLVFDLQVVVSLVATSDSDTQCGQAVYIYIVVLEPSVEVYLNLSTWTIIDCFLQIEGYPLAHGVSYVR